VARDTGAPPAPRTPPPAQRPPAPQRPRPASPPAVPPQPPRARRFEPAGASWEACAIKLQTRGIHGRFCAISAGEPSVLAYSPTFPLKRDKSAPGLTAPAALKMLVEQLAASGWRQTDVGEKPWELAFRRRIEHERPVRS
jgi:hypothetical protein